MFHDFPLLNLKTVAAAALFTFPLLGYAQDLEISSQGNEITLVWPDGNRLFSSPDLSKWNEVLGATSPFSRQVTPESAQDFFRTTHRKPSR